MERWKEIALKELPFKKSYYISNKGRVMSSISDSEKRILKTKFIKGFEAFSLRCYNTSYTFFVHKLVAENFCKKRERSAEFVIHLDYNRRNNLSDNLKWVSRKMMQTHQENNPLSLSREKQNVLNSGKYGKTLNAERVKKLKKELFNPQRSITFSQLAKEYGISEMTLYRIKRGEIWYAIKIKQEPKTKNYKTFKKVKKQHKKLKKLRKVGV